MNGFKLSKASLAAAEALDRAENSQRGHHVHGTDDIGFADGMKSAIQPADESYRRIFDLFGEGQDTDAELQKQFSEMLTRLLAFPLQKPLRQGCENSIARRFIALVYVIQPQLLEGISLHQIARQLKCAPSTIGNYTGDFSREFQFRASHQSHAGNFVDAVPRDTDDPSADGEPESEAECDLEGAT
jgi:hypothetical protein